MRRMSVLHQNSGGIGKSILDAQEISRDPRDFPREISRVEGLPRFGVARIQCNDMNEDKDKDEDDNGE